MNSRYLRPNRFEVISHRGGSLEAPENTLHAFRHSFALYSEIIFELDVHRTKDGDIAVIHDPTVDRTTDGSGAIHEKTWREISLLDAGYRFSQDGGKTFPLRGQGIRIPRLEEVISEFPNTRISIEVKRDNPAFEDQVITLVDNLKALNRVVIAAENHEILKKLRIAAGRDVCSGFSSHEVFWTLVFNRLHLPFLAPTRGDVFQIPLTHGNTQVFSKNFLDRAHKKDKHVHIWTINDEKMMRELLEMGVDGIITDAPQKLLEVAQSLKKI